MIFIFLCLSLFQRAANDMEVGITYYEYDTEDEEVKKSEAGLLPVVIQLWAVVRCLYVF